MTQETPLVDVHTAIQQRYGAIAKSVGSAAPLDCCDASSCCSGAAADPISSELYSAAEARDVPEDAVTASLGCGTPPPARARAGPAVLDLGSGGGIDVLLWRNGWDRPGKSTGLDMTDEMRACSRKPRRPAHQRRVPEGADRSHSPSGRLRGCRHLELRDQSVNRQGCRAARSLPCPQARRTLRRLGSSSRRGARSTPS